MSTNCSGKRFAVQHCRAAVKEVEELIRVNEEMLKSHPNDEAVKKRLSQLQDILNKKREELGEAETELAECESQNEN